LGKINFGLYGAKSFINKQIRDTSNFEDFYESSFIALDETLDHFKSKKWLDKKLKNHKKVYRVDDLVVMTKMCASGLGLALIPHYMAKEYKNLKLLYTPNVFVGSDLWVLTQKNLSKVPKIKACTDYLCEEISRAIKLD
jgi:DNA-binding transcriptional LysR family regulator